MSARGEPPRPAGDNVSNAPPGRTSASKFPRDLPLACAGFALLFGFVAPDIYRASILQGKLTGKCLLAPVIAPSLAPKWATYYCRTPFVLTFS